MSKQNNLTDFLTDVADAIRSKKGTTDLINPQDFSAEIAALSGGLEVIEMTETTATIEPNKVYVWGMVESLDITLGTSTSDDDFFAFRFRCGKPTMTVVTVNGATWADDTELDDSGNPVLDLGSYYQCEIKGGTSALYARLAHYIPFEDSNVEAVLMSNSIGDGIGITYADAAKVTTISTWFQNNVDITAFEEFAAFSGITSLVKFAFRYCSSLERIKLPSSINKFSGDGVFEFCTALTEIYLSSAITSMATWTFNGCTLLAKVSNLENTQVTSIGGSAFKNCSSLTEIAFPATLTGIGGSAFSGCKALVTASGLGDTQVTSIGDYAFFGCSSLTEIAFPATLTSIGGSAFSGCKALVTASGLGDTQVTSLGGSAFSGCSSLTEIAFPASLTSIGGSAFKGCIALVTASGLGDTQVTSIGDSTFLNCAKINSANIDLSKIKTFGRYCFEGTSLDGDLALPSAEGNIDYRAFAGTLISSVSDLGNIQSISKYMSWISGYYGAFYNCKNLESVILPYTITIIGNDAFRECTNLKTINFVEGIKNIQDYAFLNCYNLQIDKLSLPSLESMGYAFAFCYNLISVENLGCITTIPATNASNATKCFSCCSGLKKVKIPSTVTTLGTSDSPFWLCYAIEQVIIYAETPPSCGSNTIIPKNSLKAIYVPDGCVTAYQEATVWANYADYIKPISEYVED